VTLSEALAGFGMDRENMAVITVAAEGLDTDSRMLMVCMRRGSDEAPFVRYISGGNPSIGREHTLINPFEHAARAMRASDVREELNGRLRGVQLLAGHNAAKFVRPMLARQMPLLQEPRWLDTMHAARAILTGLDAGRALMNSRSPEELTDRLKDASYDRGRPWDLASLEGMECGDVTAAERNLTRTWKLLDRLLTHEV